MESVFAAFCAAGLWPGLGRATAEKLTAAGINSPDDVTTTALLRVDGIAAKKAEKLAKSFVDAQPRYAVAEMLHAAGLPVKAAGPIVDALGTNAAAALTRDPWRLLDTGMVEPRQVDGFALRTLTERPTKADPRRGRAFTAYALARAARDGHTVLTTDTLAAVLGGLDVPEAAAAIAAAIDDGVAISDRELVGLTRYAMAEETVAEGLQRLLASAEPLGPIRDIADGLDPAQREAVEAVAQHGVTVLHGGPGTGKSRTVAAVVELAEAKNKRIALAAPTGRAAKRLEELTGHDAQTLHRLLGAQRNSSNDNESQFLRGESWPIDADIVVVDETSMLDVELAAALIDACADGTHLLFVGDPAQLPSIGAGRVLGDILDSAAIPATELTTLHRQAEGGSIAKLGGAVREGTLPPVDDPTREVVLVSASSSAEAAHRVVQLVTDAIPRALQIDAADVQVVTPVHRGPAGTQSLNAVLKAKLNPGPGTLHGFDVGDRVVATANHLDDGFANGEVGVVTGIVEGSLMVDFAGGPVVVPPKAISDLVHGWAVTVHRAQGSEWPAVVVVLPPEASGMLSRPLVYTALTRAQRHLSIVHAAGAAVARGVRDVGARPRRTRLAQLLRG
jgi:exodeoxyribonuclease V alpha subunit